MPWNEHRVIAHGPQTLRDAGNQGVMITLWKISSTNAARKQNIAHKGTFDFRRMKHHMARRMSGAMSHVQGVCPKRYVIAIGQPPRGCENFCVRKLKHATLI
jgi:hypothetical protein